MHILFHYFIEDETHVHITITHNDFYKSYTFLDWYSVEIKNNF